MPGCPGALRRAARALMSASTAARCCCRADSCARRGSIIELCVWCEDWLWVGSVCGGYVWTLKSKQPKAERRSTPSSEVYNSPSSVCNAHWCPDISIPVHTAGSSSTYIATHAPTESAARLSHGPRHELLLLIPPGLPWQHQPCTYQVQACTAAAAAARASVQAAAAPPPGCGGSTT
jgi:hypothetical protein